MKGNDLLRLQQAAKENQGRAVLTVPRVELVTQREQQLKVLLTQMWNLKKPNSYKPESKKVMTRIWSVRGQERYLRPQTCNEW